MDTEILLPTTRTNSGYLDLDSEPGVNNVNSNFNNDNNVVNYYHPELEHLANTMPMPSVLNTNNETNNDDNDDNTADGNSNTNTTAVRSQSRMSISHDKGLLNMPGQNNCFLNSAVQVLWHLDIFRRSFRELHGHACMGDSCIFCALKELFNQFQSSTESALPPDSLRFALAQAFNDQRRFRLGYMDDAAECFENILFRIHYHITNQEPDSSSKCLAHCIPHQKFAMNLYEQIVCYSCGATSEPFIFSQMVHYISTSALCLQATKLASSLQQVHNNVGGGNEPVMINDGERTKFGHLLRIANSMGDIRNCPKLCGARMNIKKLLLNRPDIISVGLVWDTEHASLSFIRDVYKLIDTTIHLNEMFDTSTNDPVPEMDRKRLNLVGLVTYYGKHYSTYIFNTKLSKWIYFDDANVRVVGQHWQQVVDKCIKGHFQPLLLLYSNPEASIINTQNALKNIIPMTIIKKADSIDNSKTIISNKMNNENNNNNTAINSHQTLSKSSKFISSNDSQPMPTSTNHYQCDYKFKNVPLHSQYSDVPDSPSATSTTSYFSDVGDSTDGYISRKTVENILKIQQKKSNESNAKLLNGINYNRKYNRNSSSSLESFDSVVQRLPMNISIGKLNPNEVACTLQRRDSGNSTGDRASSASSNEAPYYPQRRLLNNLNRTSLKNISDQGYDSFSLSSSDSNPSNATSPHKLNHRLKKIPEDVQLIDMVNNLQLNECDKLCSEADILLLKSHEKEREGDLRAAAALSDSAAAKARLAMDIPYSNHQTLISAKMKHSMCVMRSASLHKRVLELETEEKRLLKAAMEASHHSRQSSRDSSHGRHSRQSSRDGKDPKISKETKQLPTVESKTQKDSKMNSFNLEVYATLPKKSKRKSHNKESNIITDLTTTTNTIDDCKNSTNNHVIYENLRSITSLSSTRFKMGKKNRKNFKPESDFSDYYSEWEAIKKNNTNHKHEPVQNGWQSCKENDSEGYAEFDSLQKSMKKQCKVKRKLMFGNFLKTKNRSLPDLRDDALKSNKEQSMKSEENINININNNNSRSAVANINAKGFHQSHKSFVAEQGFKTKPLLIKVKPPLVMEENLPIKKLPKVPPRQNNNEQINQSKAKESNTTQDTMSQSKGNVFLEELNKKRNEILKYNSTELQPTQGIIKNNSMPIQNCQIVDQLNRSVIKRPNPFEIANFISKNTMSNGNPINPISTANINHNNNNNNKERMLNLYVPIPVNPLTVPDGNSFTGVKLRPQRPPDYETTLKRIEMNNYHERRKSLMSPPPPCSSSPIYSNLSSLNGSNKFVSGKSEPIVSDKFKISNEIHLPVHLRTSQLIHSSPVMNDSNDCLTNGNLNDNVPLQMVNGKQKCRKKSVKFSDQIELVACADDELEEPLPNLLFEKVLGKNLIYTLQQ